MGIHLALQGTRAGDTGSIPGLGGFHLLRSSWNCLRCRAWEPRNWACTLLHCPLPWGLEPVLNGRGSETRSQHTEATPGESPGTTAVKPIFIEKKFENEKKKKATFKKYLFIVALKNPPAMQETLVRFLGQGDPLEKGKATNSRIPGLPSWLSW